MTTFIDIYTKTVAVYKGATAIVADGKTIWYTKPNAGQFGYIQEGVTNGRILYLQVNVETSTPDAIKDALGMPVATVNLTSDVTTDYLIIAAESEVTLNGDENTLTAGSANDYGLIVRDASLVINDLNIDSKGGGVAAVDGANVTFNGGNLAVNSKSTSGRYLFYAEGEGSVITINGGEFSFSKTLNQKRAYIYAGAGTTVYVKGGTFGKASTRSGYTAGILGEGTVIITGGTFGFNPSAWVAAGYKAVENAGVWTVSAI